MTTNNTNDVPEVASHDLFGSWNPPETATHGCKILGFFEDIGWYPCAWSDMEECWKVSYCHATMPFLDCGDPELAKHDEPEWRQHNYPHSDLCWWMPFPPSSHPRHSLPNACRLASADKNLTNQKETP